MLHLHSGVFFSHKAAAMSLAGTSTLVGKRQTGHVFSHMCNQGYMCVHTLHQDGGGMIWGED